MEIFVFLIAFFSVVFFSSNISSNNSSNKNSNKNSEQTPVLSWYEQKQLEYKNMNCREVRAGRNKFLFNNDLKKIVCFGVDDTQGFSLNKEFDYKDLIKCDLSENNQIISSASLGGAALGAVLGGAAGAIVGSSVGNTKEQGKIEVSMYFNDFEVSSFTTSRSTTVSMFSTREDIAEKVAYMKELYSLCEYVINQNKMNAQ